jgi:hypothetical protein
MFLESEVHLQVISGGASWLGSGQGLAEGLTAYLEKAGAGSDQAFEVPPW